MTATRRVHFPGLNALRFLAALFVILDHAPMNQQSLGLPHAAPGALFFRGSTAVAFFFSLSGFLITYLLLAEVDETGTVGVWRFYLRRVCRIWPLYFGVAAFGLAFYNLLLPRLGIAHPVTYSLLPAVALYVFFLPNLLNSLHTVGGILNPLWSIGVEEQFYLAWAPLVRGLRRHVPWLCAAVFVVFYTLSSLNQALFFGHGWQEKFIGQLRFHFMAAGGICAWLLHRHRERFLAFPAFSSRLCQGALYIALANYYILNLPQVPSWAEETFQLLIYNWLIVNTAANSGRLVRLENRALDYLGTISYGVYMLHMPAIYATTFLFQRSGPWNEWTAIFYPAYYVIAIGGTVLAAHLSYRYFESPFLRLKDVRYGSRSRAVLAGATSVLAE